MRDSKTGDEPAAPVARGNLGVTHPWPIFSHPKGKDFVDFDEDLQVKDLKNGAADGYDDIELLKRYSTVGMGPSQGKYSAVAAARVLAKETGRDLASAQRHHPAPALRAGEDRPAGRPRVRAGAAHRPCITATSNSAPA